jgi:hypothetical protein
MTNGLNIPRLCPGSGYKAEEKDKHANYNLLLCQRIDQFNRWNGLLLSVFALPGSNPTTRTPHWQFEDFLDWPETLFPQTAGSNFSWQSEPLMQLAPPG